MAIQAPIWCGCHSLFFCPVRKYPVSRVESQVFSIGKLLFPVFYLPYFNQGSIRQRAVRIDLRDFMIGIHGLCSIRGSEHML